MEEINSSHQFRRVVLGAVLATANECGYRNSKKVELLHWCSEILDSKTIDELEKIYMDHARGDHDYFVKGGDMILIARNLNRMIWERLVKEHELDLMA